MIFQADLHVHTALSPCAGEEMTPPAICRAAVEAGLSMIAVCDHNSAGNAAAVQEAAEALGCGALDAAYADCWAGLGDRFEA